jgi:hypothetical protein
VSSTSRRRHYVAVVYLSNPHEWWREVFAVPLDVTGTPIAGQIQVSESPDPTPDDGFQNQTLPTGAAIAPAPPDGEHMVVWAGADPEPPLAKMQEIGSRRLRDPAAGTAPPETLVAGGASPRALAIRLTGGAVRRSRLSPPSACTSGSLRASAALSAAPGRRASGSRCAPAPARAR